MRWPPHNSENGFQKRLSEKCSLPKIDRGVAFTRFVKWFHYPSARAPPAGLDIYIYYAAACRRVASLAAVALPLPFAAPPFDSRPALAADVPTRLSLLALSQTASCCTISPGAARAAFLLVAHGVVDKLLVRDALPVAVVGQSRGAPPHSRHFNVVQLVEAPFFHLLSCSCQCCAMWASCACARTAQSAGASRAVHPRCRPGPRAAVAGPTSSSSCGMRDGLEPSRRGARTRAECVVRSRLAGRRPCVAPLTQRRRHATSQATRHRLTQPASERARSVRGV